MIVKSARTALIVFSVVSTLCATSTIMAVDEPLFAEDEPVLNVPGNLDDQSSFELLTVIEGLQQRSWNIGPEVYYFRYEEPSMMKSEGVFVGINVNYTCRAWVPEYPEDLVSESKYMLRAEGRFAWGEVDYDGQTWDGTPVTMSSIDDFALETRLIFGPDFLTETSIHTFFTGIGYRYLNNDSSDYMGGYERESNYLYLPLGFELTSQETDGWSWGAAIEFDLLLWGSQRSHLSDVGLSDVDNEQNSGYGLRASFKLQKRNNNTSFIIEPFVRYWNIEESEVAYSDGIPVVEPDNETIEAGIRLLWAF